jgi:ABC-type branched-subunit amino acid transport system substrate-binding protein
MMRSRKRWTSILLVPAVLAVGCGDDKESSSTTEAPPKDESTTTAGSGGEAATGDPIKVGLSYLDFDDLKAKGLAPNGWGDQEMIAQTYIDLINDGGGLGGRPIEVVYHPYTPLGTEAAEAACLAMTEDDDVQVVLGGFLGPAEPANTCIAGQGETILVGGTMSEERLSEAKAPWITYQVMRTQQAQILLDLLAKEDMIKGAKVAVVTGPQAEDVRESLNQALDDHDVEVVADLVNEASSGEVVAEDQAWATIAEKIRAEGADTVLLAGSTAAGVRNIASQGLDVDVWVLDQEELRNLGSTVELDDARGAVTAAALTGQELWEDDTVKECREEFEAAHPDIEVLGPNELPEGEEAWWEGIVHQCRIISVFETVMGNLDGELSNESFAAAVDATGDFEAPGQPFASLGKSKFTTNDSFQLAEFDPDTGQNGSLKGMTDIEDVTT